MSTTRQPNLLILLGGFCSSALALILVALINHLGFNLMGLHVVFILPAGAILVGALSGIGYAICSQLFNVKIRPAFLLVIVTLALVTYVFSHLITYLYILKQNQSNPLQYTVISYVRDLCEFTTYKSGRYNDQGVQLGLWGYLFQFVELLGFVLGCMVPTMVLAAKPYCDRCQLYMDKVKSIYHFTSLGSKQLKAAKGKKEKTDVLVWGIQEATAQFSGWWQANQMLAWEQVEEYLLKQVTTRPKDSLAIVQTDLYVCGECSMWHIVANLTNPTVNGGYNANKEIHDSRKVPRIAPDQPRPQPMPGQSEGIQELD